jgi:hypothetical protein
MAHRHSPVHARFVHTGLFCLLAGLALVFALASGTAQPGPEGGAQPTPPGVANEPAERPAAQPIDPPPPEAMGGPEARPGDGRDPGRHRGPMGRGRPGGQGGPVNNLPRLVQLDGQLQQHRKEFERIDHERNRLLDQLADERARYEPNRLTPATVLQRQSIDRLLATLHASAERERQNNDQALRLLKLAAVSASLWNPLLKQSEKTTHTPTVVISPEMRKRWTAAGAALANQNASAFAEALVGPQYSPVLLQFADNEPEGPTLSELMVPGNQPPFPLLRLGEAARGRLAQRLDRLEQRVTQLLEEASQQQREVLRLRQALTQGVEKGAKDEDKLKKSDERPTGSPHMGKQLRVEQK